MTVAETYKKVYNLHYKFLTRNHMAKDIARKSATIYAVKNTWKVHNENT